MTAIPLVDRVRDALGDMLELERRIRERARASLETSGQFESAHQIVKAVMETAERHIEALNDRFERGSVAAPAPPELAAAVEPTADESVPGILIDLYVDITSAVVRYSAVQPITHRFRDSGTIYETGSTGVMTRALTQEYMALLGRINETLHNAVLWEMDARGEWCQCVCPSCGLGLCVCAVASRSILNEAWAEATPSVAETGLEIQRPRPGSSAEQAGFRRGDVLVAVDGEPVNQTSVVQKGIKKHARNDKINFIVKRNGDVLSLSGERWSDLGIEPEDILDTCVLPAGQEFFVDRAKEAKDKLSERIAGDTPLATGLASLTPREIQVLRMVSNGASNPLIAEELEISRATVARHIANILEKLGAANRAEAASLATANGIVVGR